MPGKVLTPERAVSKMIYFRVFLGVIVCACVRACACVCMCVCVRARTFVYNDNDACSSGFTKS